MAVRPAILYARFPRLIEEAEANPAFQSKLLAALGYSKDGRINTTETLQRAHAKLAPAGKRVQSDDHLSKGKRPSNRRAAALLDPVLLARESEAKLREALRKLNLEQLKDVVADYGMDSGKLVIKWKTPERIIDRIADVAMQRAQKGDAFREDKDELPK